MHHGNNRRYLVKRLAYRIQHIKACAHSFRRFASYRIAILFFLGKLDLYPQTSL